MNLLKQYSKEVKFMKANAGTLDRAIRIVIGLIVLSLAFIGPQTAWAYLGLIPLLTGAVGFCPLYTLFGLKTCPTSKK